ncbi:IgGFc-binding protein-like [Emydura macquarii macquarii]|uniref:IgGFc-binding protein-like n=1 Tax=Emydura macquarii macquarii TaxID=1129001 RepID=UPI00352B3C58
MEGGRQEQLPGAWLTTGSGLGQPWVFPACAAVPAKRHLLWLILALLLGPCSADPLGQEFVTVFMQNFVSSYGLPNLELHIASYSPNTTVDVTVSRSSFHSRLLLQPGEPVSVQLPSYTEMLRSSRTNHTVLVVADKEVLVVAFNDKLYTTAASVLYPVREWGREYYIFTPSGEPDVAFKEFAIVNHGQRNLVDVYLKGSVIFENFRYRARSRLRLSLGERSAVQLQSKDDLSGSRVVAERPVAVFSGNTCARRNSQCNHVFQQLLPVPRWGSSFLVPPLPFQPGHDLVYITAAQQVEVAVHRGAHVQLVNMTRGQVLEQWVGESQGLYISSTAAVQVIFFSTGGRLMDNLSFDPFLLNIPAAGSYCTSYLAISHPSFTSYVLLVTPTSAVSELSFNGKEMPPLDWQGIANTSFTWAAMALPPDSGYNVLAHPHAPFGLLSVGISHMNGYGSPAVCLDKVLGPCSSMHCRPAERCKVTGGAAFCYAASSRTCWVSSRSHYRTFDGQSYEFPGGCTVILVQTDGLGQRLPAFTVTAQKGSAGLDSLVVLELPDDELVVGLMGSDASHAWVNHQRRPLPASMGGGKVRISQHGVSSVIKTSFGLRLSFSQPPHITVVIPGSYQGLVQGLCGNSNGNASDDLVMPGGAQAPDSAAFGNAWRVPGPDERPCWSKCPGRCRRCLSANVTALYGSQELCGMVRAPGGPFSPCHLVVPPQDFYESCLSDLCMSGGARRSLCLALAAYAAVCQAEGITLDGWREVSSCTLQCPPHSRLQTCASACPAACSDLAAPDKCPAPCHETCVCLNGFLQRAAACIPRGECGCALEGRYPAAGKIWGESCLSVCTCHAATGEVVCHNTSCGAQESCHLVDGAWGCHPLPYASCLAYGDARYVPFSGGRFEHQGGCSYRLAGSCSEDVFSGTVPFYVQVHTRPDPSRLGPATKSVEIGVYDKVISLSQEQRGTVLVDGLLVHLPYFLKNQLMVFRSSWDVLVKTDSGLTVAFDGDGRLRLSLPTTHVAGVCGLCGNVPGGGGASPGVGDVQSAAVGCGPAACKGNCTACARARRYGAVDRCGMMTAANGPFRGCHRTVDPSGYFWDCISDLCAHQGDETVLCRALAAYTAACQEAQASVDPWRNGSFCSPSCPPNSRYEPCAPACPATCCNRSLPGPCLLPCREGCRCTPGHVLSGDRCVLPAGCGCLHQEMYWPLGSSFYTEACQERCTCQAPGRVECQPHICGAHEACSIQGGRRGCFPAPFVTCSAFGSGHHISFDGMALTLRGNCSRVLAEMPAAGNLTAFSVSLLSGESQATWPEIRVPGHRLTLSRGTAAIQVDGVWGYLPLDLSGSVRVFLHGRILRLETDFGLQVAYDGASLVTVSIPGPNQRHVAGLCGNYNGSSSDTSTLLDGSISPNASAFADVGPGCYVEGELQWPPCTGNESQPCRLLIAKDGPFASCHATVKPLPYVNACLSDACSGNCSSTVHCGALSSYAAMCQAAGVTLEHWRDLASCPLHCPENSHYTLCMDPCSAACLAKEAGLPCQRGCMEGCKCHKGYYWDGATCVRPGSCGCYSNGTTYKARSVVVKDHCQQKCTCSPARELVCQANACTAQESCAVREGLVGCYDLCQSITCQPNEMCHVEEGQVECVPLPTASCLVWDHLHYRTFDGYDYDFHGTCLYTIAEYCGEDAQQVPFTIRAHNNPPGDPAVTSTRWVYIGVYGYNISMHKLEYGRIWVNNVSSPLPVSLGVGRGWVWQSGLSALLETDFGLRVSYDWGWRLVVTLPSTYANRTCGLCGNFNGNTADERMAPGHAPMQSDLEWAASWSVPLEGSCWRSHQRQRLGCGRGPLALRLYHSAAYCGLLNWEPFQPCHAAVDPESFFQRCMADVCVYTGARRVLCQALEAYAATCRYQGIILDWRATAGCAVEESEMEDPVQIGG